MCFFSSCYFSDDLTGILEKNRMKASKTLGSKDFVSNQKRTKNPSRTQKRKARKGRIPKP